MNKTLTLDEILLFTYGETCEMFTDDVMQNLITSDEYLNEEFQFFYDTKQIINESMQNPPDQLVNRIISYSKALTILTLSEPDLKMMIKN